MRDKQKGSALWIVLLIVLIVVLALAFWYVWQNNRSDKSEDSSQQASQDGSDQSSQQQDETSDWRLFEAPNGEYSVRIPDGWKLKAHNSTSSLYNACAEPSQCLVYKPGEKAIVTGTDVSEGVPFFFFVKPQAEGENEQVFFTGFEQTGTFEAQNVTGNTYKKTITQDEFGYSVGDVQYGYAFTKGDNVIFATYTVYKGQVDDKAAVDKMLGTLILK